MKNKTKQVEVEEPQVQEEVIVKEVRPTKVAKPNNSWTIKDRHYYLKNGLHPLSYSMKTADIYWFDEGKGYERELKYTINQNTVFVDEMVGDQRITHVVFRNGSLFVPKEKTVLQKLLSLYHPHRDKLFTERDAVAEATSELDNLELEIQALTTAQGLDIDMAEAVMRVEIGSAVSEMDSRELKRDLLLYAKKNPKLFLDLVNDDNVMLRNFGIKAVEMGIIRLSQDQRTFNWGSTDRKLMTVPFDEHPYSALAQWFRTDEGMEIYSNIEKRFK